MSKASLEPKDPSASASSTDIIGTCHHAQEISVIHILVITYWREDAGSIPYDVQIMSYLTKKV